MIQVIKKPGTAGDGRGEWVAFSGREYRYYFDIGLSGSASAGIDQNSGGQGRRMAFPLQHSRGRRSGLCCGGDCTAAAIWRLCPRLWRYIRGALSGTGNHRVSGTGREGGDICFCAVDAVHISRIYMRRIYVSPAHRLIFLRCQSCVE